MSDMYDNTSSSISTSITFPLQSKPFSINSYVNVHHSESSNIGIKFFSKYINKYVNQFATYESSDNAYFLTQILLKGKRLSLSTKLIKENKSISKYMVSPLLVLILFYVQNHDRIIPNPYFKILKLKEGFCECEAL